MSLGSQRRRGLVSSRPGAETFTVYEDESLNHVADAGPSSPHQTTRSRAVNQRNLRSRSDPPAAPIGIQPIAGTPAIANTGYHLTASHRPSSQLPAKPVGVGILPEQDHRPQYHENPLSNPEQSSAKAKKTKIPGRGNKHNEDKYREGVKGLRDNLHKAVNALPDKLIPNRCSSDRQGVAGYLQLATEALLKVPDLVKENDELKKENDELKRKLQASNPDDQSQTQSQIGMDMDVDNLSGAYPPSEGMYPETDETPVAPNESINAFSTYHPFNFNQYYATNSYSL